MAKGEAFGKGAEKTNKNKKRNRFTAFTLDLLTTNAQVINKTLNSSNHLKFDSETFVKQE